MNNQLEFLMTLFNKGDNVFFKWKNDPNWSVEYVSSNVENLLGYTQEQFISHQINYEDIIHDDDLDCIIQEVDLNVTHKSDSFKHLPYRIYTKDKKIKWIMDTTVLVYDKDNNVTHFIGYLSDITLSMNYQDELKKTIDEKTKSLKILNDKLKKQVQQEVSKSKIKDNLLFQQSKMAMMGEMLGNIAHQWKQPLSTISFAATGIQLNKELGLLDDELLNKSLNSIVESSSFLSNTVDDFRNFLKPNHKKEKFTIKSIIEKTLLLIVGTLETNNVKVYQNISDFEIYGIKGELTQVLLNIINNAKDIVIENNQNNERFIFIDTISTDDKFIITIKDDGGGIPQDIIDKVFEQYFTTKTIEGTGIGLHMSSEIIKTHFNGKLQVENRNYNFNGKNYTGAIFEISIPKI